MTLMTVNEHQPAYVIILINGSDGTAAPAAAMDAVTGYDEFLQPEPGIEGS